MNPKLQRRVQRYGWDLASQYYENLWQAQLIPAHDAVMEMARAQPGDSAIDIAAGTGIVTFRIAEIIGSEGTILGTDISEEMVRSATREAETRGYSNARFQRMDAESLDVEKGQFDLATSALGLMYFPDPESAIEEMHRVLKPGGRAIAAVWGARANCGWAEIFPIVDARVQSEVCPMFYRLGTGDALEQAFAESGFSRIETRRIDAPLLYNSEREAWEAAFLGGPVALAYFKFDDTVKVAVQKEYLKSIETYRLIDGGYRVPGEFVVTIGYK